MSDILCVTNRTLCREDFLQRIDAIAAARPAGIILREKDLSEQGYRALAEQVLSICRRVQVPCILHTFAGTAIELRADALHVPLPVLRAMTAAQKGRFTTLGASCHSVEDAREAEALGCTYITAGHIFDTDCKKGLPGRGLDFLRGVCDSVSLPVYAIGGISGKNVAAVRRAGAKGACVMSALMQCADVEACLKSYGEEYEV